MANLTGSFKLKGGPISALYRAISAAAGDRIVNYIRDRIRLKGQGQGGAGVKGYSTKPLSMRQDGRSSLGKASIPPQGGIPRGKQMFFPGGYKEYREKAGLQTAHIDLSNMGNLWLGWGILRHARPGNPMAIGFRRKVDAIAANSAQENGRPTLFLLDSQELYMLSAGVEALITKHLFGP